MRHRIGQIADIRQQVCFGEPLTDARLETSGGVLRVEGHFTEHRPRAISGDVRKGKAAASVRVVNLLEKPHRVGERRSNRHGKRCRHGEMLRQVVPPAKEDGAWLSLWPGTGTRHHCGGAFPGDVEREGDDTCTVLDGRVSGTRSLAG